MAPIPYQIRDPDGGDSDVNPNELLGFAVLTQGFCVVVPGILWLLRLYVRACVKKVWVLEDNLAVLSFVSLALYSIFLSHVLHCGGGIHEADLQPPYSIDKILYWVFIVELFYGPAAAIIKTTILVLYLRVFSPHKLFVFDNAVRYFMFVIWMFYIAVTAAEILVRENGVSPRHLVEATGGFNVGSDLLILLVPLVAMWKMRVSMWKKVGVWVVFTVGAVGPIFSIVGFIMRFQMDGDYDSSYQQPALLLWFTAELAAGMMVICLPTLPGLLERRKPQPQLSSFITNARVPTVEHWTMKHHGKLNKTTAGHDMEPKTWGVEVTSMELPDMSTLVASSAGLDSTAVFVDKI